MKEVKGDLIYLAKQGHFDVIIHGCNCFNTMGSGIALQIQREFPEAYRVDCKTLSGDTKKLGTYSYADVIIQYKHFDQLTSSNLTIVNAYSQFYPGHNELKQNYNAIRTVFTKIKQDYSGKRIGIPLLGAGLAGGDWKIIKSIIEEIMVDENITVVIYKK